jgi:nucleotide-binding universal stress UspA family protein
VEQALLPHLTTAALIVMAEPHNLDSMDALHSALFSSGRPVLFVPSRAPALTPFGRHVAIAWKPRPQARRAIKQSAPWLKAAQQVSILCVNERDIVHDADEAFQLLAEMGCAAETRHLVTNRAEHVATRLLQEVEAIGADLIVMGAYRFGEVVEFVFGGVTREILDQSRWPVILMH